MRTIDPGGSYAALDAYVEGQMRRLKIPGASLAVVEGDRIAYQRGYGCARPGAETPSPQTSFFIGSLTKSITALAVMQLVEAGKVDLDAPVQRYLPWFRVADPATSAGITVRHLLNQTSGLPTLPGQIVLADIDDSSDAIERQVRALATLKPSRPAGTTFQYCNLNYNILGLIIEAASREAYANYIRHHILDPLQMVHTYTSKEAAQQTGLAMGHRLWFGEPIPAPDLPIPRGSLPSGQLISCAEDMAHYLIAHLNGGCYGGPGGEVRILSDAGIDELHRGVAEWMVGNSSVGRYGMGWVESSLDGAKVLSHSGNVPDFSAFMALLPAQQKGLVLLFNADPYGLPMITEEVGAGAVAVLAGQQPPPNRLEFVQRVMRSLPLIPLLQIAGAAATLRLVRRWRREPALRPPRSQIWGRHLLLPLIPDLSLVTGLAYLRSSGLLGFLRLFMPDLAWILRVSAVLAGLRAVLRTGLVLRATTSCTWSACSEKCRDTCCDCRSLDPADVGVAADGEDDHRR